MDPPTFQRRPKGVITGPVFPARPPVVFTVNHEPPPVNLKTILFPRPQRDFKGQRWARISLRTWHLLSFGFLLGGTAQGYPLTDQTWALWNTFLSGMVLSGLELHATCVWLFQLKGQAVLVKFLLLGAAVAAPGGGMPFLIAAVVIGGISSHMPGKYRYYSLYHGRSIKE